MGTGEKDEYIATILLVDDTPKNLELLITYLEEHEYTVLIARSGETAFESAKYSIPDLILLDINMPNMNGYDTCKLIKSHPATASIPIIFMSALNETVDKVRGFQVGAVDYITKPIDKAELIARINTHLTIARLQNELRVSKEKAEAANKAKSEFLANISHEIRTPMNSILGFCQILQDRIDDAENSRYLSSIYSSGEILLSLINDILDLSKIEAGKMTLQYRPISLQQVLTDMEMLFVQQTTRKGLDFTVSLLDDFQSKLVMDELRLKQILINLISNAVKFTSEGEVTVLLSIENSTDTTVTVTLKVRDTGKGIPENELDLVFQAFEQVKDQETIQFGGTGLGLSIVKRLTGLMGGDISVSSTVGKGSEFTVIIPNVKVDDALTTTRDSAAGQDISALSFKPASVLIADDTEANRNVMISFLKRYSGLRIRAVENGAEALFAIEEERPDILFLDMKMPLLSGPDTVKRLKENPESADIVVIATTASITGGEEDQMRKLCDGYLEKPIIYSKLIEILTHYLETE